MFSLKERYSVSQVDWLSLWRNESVEMLLAVAQGVKTVKMKAPNEIYVRILRQYEKNLTTFPSTCRLGRINSYDGIPTISRRLKKSVFRRTKSGRPTLCYTISELIRLLLIFFTQNLLSNWKLLLVFILNLDCQNRGKFVKFSKLCSSAIFGRKLFKWSSLHHRYYCLML